MYLNQVPISEPPPISARTREPWWLAHDLCWQRLMDHFDQVPSLDRFKEGLLNASVISLASGMSSSERSPPARTDGSFSVQDSPCNFLTEKGPSLETFKRSLRLGKAQAALLKCRRRSVNLMNGSLSVFDPFRLLPLELRLNIAQYLPTVDFLSLRLSSRAMTPLFESQQFWRTRFCVHGERGFLSFLKKTNCKDWRTMYRTTNRVRAENYAMSCIMDRWHESEMIRDMCLITGAPGLIPTNKEAQRQLHYKVDTVIYPHTDSTPKVATYRERRFGYIKNPHARTPKPRHPLISHTIIIPRRVLKIAVSVFNKPYVTDITGLDFIHGSDKPEVTSFGYRIPGKQTTVDLCGGSLVGFDVAFTCGGIQAIRAVATNSDGTLYNWVGSKGRGWQTPSVERLDAESDIMILSGLFRVSNVSKSSILILC